MANAVLYMTEYCHLCEEALGILYAQGTPVTPVDISDDDALVSRYGTRIPVLLRLDTEAELGWPFGAEDVVRFMAPAGT